MNRILPFSRPKILSMPDIKHSAERHRASGSASDRERHDNAPCLMIACSYCHRLSRNMLSFGHQETIFMRSIVSSGVMVSEQRRSCRNDGWTSTSNQGDIYAAASDCGMIALPTREVHNGHADGFSLRLVLSCMLLLVASRGDLSIGACGSEAEGWKGTKQSCCKLWHQRCTGPASSRPCGRGDGPV